MKTNFFLLSQKSKIKKKSQKLNEMRLKFVYVEANMYNHTPSRAPRLAPTPADARRERKIRCPYSRT